MHLQFWSGKVDESNRSAEFMGGWVSEETHAQMVADFPKPFYGFDEVDLIVGHGDCCNGHYEDWLAERAPEYLPVLKEFRGKILADIYRKSPIPEELYPTSYVTDRSIDFLENSAKGDYGKEPFLLKVSYPDPHHPCTPPSKYADMYKPEDMELPASFNDMESLRDHKFVGPRLNLPGIMNKMLLHAANEEEAKNFISHTYGMVSMIDDSFGAKLHNLLVILILDHLDKCLNGGIFVKRDLVPFFVPNHWLKPLTSINLSGYGLSHHQLHGALEIFLIRLFSTVRFEFQKIGHNDGALVILS